MGSDGISLNITEHHGIQWNDMEYQWHVYGISVEYLLNIIEYHGTHMQYHVTYMDNNATAMEYEGTS